MFKAGAVFLYLLILILLNLISGIITYNGCESIRCENLIGGPNFVNPVKCNAYCECNSVSNEAKYFDCPAGYYYDIVSQSCSSTNDLDCGNDYTDTTLCDNVRCPVQNGEYSFGIPNPANCEEFCQCSWGRPYVTKCNADPNSHILRFNYSTALCDYTSVTTCPFP